MASNAAIEALLVQPRTGPGLGSWARERIQGRQLDQKLAAGAAPDGDRALTLHTYRILKPRNRARIADGLENAWRDADGPQGLSPKAPLARHAILAAAPELGSIIAELRTDDQCDARGVALARLLLHDAGSPLYEPAAPDELTSALSRIYRGLRFGDPD